MRPAKGRELLSVFRKPSVAGLFYPSDPKKLSELINGFLRLADPPDIANNICGIVAPHAGYIYSGATAAYAYNLIKNEGYKTVIIVSPSHTEYFPGISIYSGDGYTTPLGNIPVDKLLIDKLVSDSNHIIKGDIGHKTEHAIEVQLPFLQTVLSDFRIVPVVMGDQSPIYINELAERVASVYNDDILLIASSDLSHYYNRKKANTLDSIIERRISEYDFNSLMSDLDSKKCEACGGGPIVAIMKALYNNGIRMASVLKRTDSGEVSGDLNQVVGYLSAVLYN